MDHYTKKVSDFAVQTSGDLIQPEAIEVAKTAMLDCVGVTLAGSKEESVKICARLAQEETSNCDATVIGQGFKTSTLMAAFCNGTAAHALDFDYGFPYWGQPTASLVPAILSLGEKTNTKGRDFLEAYVVGFEVTARLARSMPEHSGKGRWHAVGTLGTLGSAVACAKMLGLDTRAVQCTLGIASSMASGIVWNYGTMTKPLHAGLAARNGMIAAKLAQDGFTANPNLIEKQKGFFNVFSRNLPCDLGPLDSLGSSFDLVERGIMIKTHPCAGLSHTAVDALLILRAQDNMKAEAIESIKVSVTQHAFEKMSGQLAQNGIQGKFSMPYILARAFVDGKISLDMFTDEAVRDPIVSKLAEKVEMTVGPEIQDTLDGSAPSEVTMRSKDGRVFSHRSDYAKGTPQFPMTPEELKAKFIDCACRALDKATVLQVVEFIDHLEDLENVGTLCQLLIGHS